MPTGTHDHLALGSDTAGSATSTDQVLFGLGWVLMVTAMMGPMLIPALRHLYARSLASRRRRAVGLMTLAAMAVWTVVSLGLFAVAALLRSVTGSAGLALATGLVAAAAWQVSPWKQYALNRHCTEPPVPAFGRPADRAAMRYGCTHAAWSSGSCWALMLLPLLAPARPLTTMLIVSAWMWIEPFDRPVSPSWRVRYPRRALRVTRAAFGRSSGALTRTSPG